MPLPVKAVLFDLDGTLIDTAPDFTTVLNQQLQAYGRPTLTVEEIRSAVSQGSKAVVARGFADLQTGDLPAFEAIREEFLSAYLEHIADESCLFPGMDALLAALEVRQIPWGIVTNKPSLYTLPLLKALDLDRRCKVAICPDMVTNTKPHPEPMLKAAATLNVAPEKCLYVGDHRRDIEAGKNAAMTTVAAAWGYILEDESVWDWQADHTVSTVEELSQLLGLS